VSGTLVSAAELEAALDRVKVCDIRWSLTDPGHGVDDYRSGHIPGAVFVDLDADLAGEPGPGRHPLPPISVFAETLGRLGLSTSDRIVVYDDTSGAIAARMWWMLRSIGHDQVAVLDGGLQSWVASDFPLETGEVEPVPSRYLPLSGYTGVVGHTSLDDLTVIDVRDHRRYTGEVEPVDPKAGHIPGAISIPLSENLDESGRFRDPEELAGLYSTLDDVALSCGSGVNACHTALAMVHAGREMPAVYVGSFSDWSRRDLPVAIGPKP
jgi:thiosulfate/3-mercaptopyruvate sulfurtransferase